MGQARLGQLVSQFILAAVANQLATRGGRKVALVLERDLTAAVEPEGFCTACRQCFDAEGVFRLPVPADRLRQAVDRGAPTEAACPAGLAFLAEPLAIGPAHVIGYLAIGHVADVKALEERLFALAQEADDKPANLARRHWNTTKPEQVDWSVYAHQLRQAAIPLVTVAAATWQEYAEVPSRPPDELDDLHLLPRDAPDTLRTALRRACLANDADAGAALLPPERVSSLPEVVAFNLFPGAPARIASLRAELERELAHQAAVAIASLAGHPALAAAGFTPEGFRSALLSRSAVLGEGGPSSSSSSANRGAGAPRSSPWPRSGPGPRLSSTSPSAPESGSRPWPPPSTPWASSPRRWRAAISPPAARCWRGGRRAARAGRPPSSSPTSGASPSSWPTAPGRTTPAPS